MTKFPTIPIIDGLVKSPLAADAQLIRIIEGGTKQTGAYEAGAEIEVTHGTILELLANGNRKLMTVECVDPALVPVVEPEPVQEYPETDSADSAVEQRSLVERVRVLADQVVGKKWDDLTDKQKCGILAVANPIVADFLPPRGAVCMPSEFEAAKTPMLRKIETFMGFRDPNKEFGGADIPEQEDFPKFSEPADVVVVNPPGAEVLEREYDPESLLENATPCTSSDDAGTDGSLSDEA